MYVSLVCSLAGSCVAASYVLGFYVASIMNIDEVRGVGPISTVH